MNYHGYANLTHLRVRGCLRLTFIKITVGRVATRRTRVPLAGLGRTILVIGIANVLVSATCQQRFARFVWASVPHLGGVAPAFFLAVGRRLARSLSRACIRCSVQLSWCYWRLCRESVLPPRRVSATPISRSCFSSVRSSLSPRGSGRPDSPTPQRPPVIRASIRPVAPAGARRGRRSRSRSPCLWRGSRSPRPDASISYVRRKRRTSACRCSWCVPLGVLLFPDQSAVLVAILGSGMVNAVELTRMASICSIATLGIIVRYRWPSRGALDASRCLTV